MQEESETFSGLYDKRLSVLYELNIKDEKLAHQKQKLTKLKNQII